MISAENNIQSSAPPAKRLKLVEAAGAHETKENASVDDAPMDTNGSANGAAKSGGGIHNGTLANADHSSLDKNLYSRQIYALGESAMMHLRTASVLISGMDAVGVEIAKNLILGGIRHVTIQDTKAAAWSDLSAQYYITEAEIGQNRAAVCFERLTELNDSVTVNCVTDPLTVDLVEKFNLTILTDSTLSEQLKVNEWTRAKDKLMIVADSRGLFAEIFVDFGDQFRIDDANGEQCNEVFIEHVDKVTGDVMTLENAFHGLEDGDYVTFAEVKGMTELNDIKPIKVTVKTAAIFNIGDAAQKFADYKEGGRAKQVKMPKLVNFKPLKEALAAPELVISDYAKFDRPAQYHVLWQALHKFVEQSGGRLPMPRSDSDAATLRKILPETEVEVDEKLLKAFSYQATGNLCPMASFIGGVAAQEAMKAVTHHMSPINQFFYFDALEALPGDYSAFDESKLTEEMCAPRKSRYDGQAAVFGWDFQEAVLKQKWFIVGAGAIGCELLKNFAMMGVASSDQKLGKLKITDMDQIEISNLNRQFLFRRHDVGGKKSEVAAKAVKQFNQHLNVEALSERVGGDTEQIFTDSFFHELNGVANALDNVDARRYMDRRCVYYGLPLLESGTMGAKGNTQVVYPYLTESYGSSNDPPERSIPICTLKNFPNEIQHTIQWARDLFEGLFTNPAETADQFLDDQRAFFERVDKMHTGQKLEILEQVKKALIDDKPKSAEACVEWARLLWQEYFHNSIGQLLHTFPADQVTDHGVKFWSGTKRCPHMLQFDVNQEEHFNFVYAASVLRAQQYNLTPITDRATVAKLAAACEPEPFVPRTGVKIAVTEAEAKEHAEQISVAASLDDVDQQLQALHLALAKLNPKTITPLVPIDFEKDDDSNHHMDFVTAASNLRAENYDIPKADRMKTKQIAGRIIPAIATTTAAVAGLVSIEFYKMIDADGRLPKTPIDRFKNGFINLALPFFGFSEPIEAPKKKYNDTEFTLWDRFDIKGPKTLQELFDWLKNEHGLDATMLSCGVSLLYSFFMPEAKRKARLEMTIKTLVETVAQKPVPEHTRDLVLEVMASDATGEDVETPYIKYMI